MLEVPLFSSGFADRVLGKLYGFPSCCIDFYCRSSPEARRQAKGFLGYRFCPACAERPEEEVINQINLCRISPTPFPVSPRHEHLGKILRNQKWSQIERAWLMENSYRFLRRGEAHTLAEEFHNKMVALDHSYADLIEKEPERQMYLFAVHEQQKQQLVVDLVQGIYGVLEAKGVAKSGPDSEPGEVW